MDDLWKIWTLAKSSNRSRGGKRIVWAEAWLHGPEGLFLQPLRCPAKAGFRVFRGKERGWWLAM